MKLHDFWKVRHEVSKAVVARIQIKFVFDSLPDELCVQRGCAFFKAVTVTLAAIEIDRHSTQALPIFLGKNERVVVLPMVDINRVAENRRDQVRQGIAGLHRKIEFLRRFGDERRALRTYRRKEFRVREGEAQRAVAAHGNATDGTMASALFNAVLRFDEGQEFLQKEVTVEDFAIGGIYVKSSSTLWRDDKKISDFVLTVKIVEKLESSAVEQRSFIIAKAVQEKQNWIGLRGVVARIVACWKIDAVMHFGFQNAAADSAAIDSALSVNIKRHD